MEQNNHMKNSAAIFFMGKGIYVDGLLLRYHQKETFSNVNLHL